MVLVMAYGMKFWGGYSFGNQEIDFFGSEPIISALVWSLSNHA